MAVKLEVSALEIEKLAAKIPLQRLVWAEFDDGTVGMTTITEEEYTEALKERIHDSLPKHYRDVKLNG